MSSPSLVQDVVIGLRRELAEMRLTGARGRRCAMAAGAAVLAVSLALALHVEDAWWAAISAFVCSQATAPASVQRGVLRILGTLAGAAMALSLSPWLAGDPIALSLALFLVSAVGVLGLLVSSYGYAWLLGAVTVDMVLMALLSNPASAIGVGVSRSAEVIIGTVSAMLVALLVGPEAHPRPVAHAPGWSNLLGDQWPAVRHAVRAGLAVMLVPLVWSWLDLPSLSQTAVTAAAVMAVPAVSGDAAADQRKVTERAIHRLLGCVAGGVAGLGCLAVSVDSLLPWMMMLTAGIWISAHVQASDRGIGYVGTQAAVVFISTLVQGAGPPTSILPGIERFAGITGGLLILLGVLVLTAPDGVTAAASPRRAS
ncbi:MAG TPA: FUSC family protein [Rhodopila sp.]